MAPILSVSSGGAAVNVVGGSTALAEFLQGMFDKYFIVTWGHANPMAAIALKLHEDEAPTLDTPKPTLEPTFNLSRREIFYDHYDPRIAITVSRTSHCVSKFDVWTGREGTRVYPMLYRFIRSVLLQLHLQDRGSFLHASAVAIDDQVLAFVGPKFTGKTTCMIAMCKYTDAAPVTNDKLLVEVCSEGAWARGFPIKAGIRQGTLDLLDTGGTFETLVSATSDKVVRLSMHNLAQLYNKRPVTAGRLAAIFLPTHDQAIDGFDVRACTSEEVSSVWADHQLKTLSTLDPEQQAVADFFPPTAPVATIPSVPIFACRSNEHSLKAMTHYLHGWVKAL